MQPHCVRVTLVIHRGRQVELEGVVEFDRQVSVWLGNEERRSIVEFELKG